MSNPLDTLFGETEGAAQPQPEVQAPEPVKEAASEPVARGPERGSDGKFTAKAPETAPEGEQAPVDPEKPLTQRELNGVLGKALDERDKRQALEREAADLRRQIADLQSRAEPQTVTAEHRMMSELHDLRAEQQRVRADMKHGGDTVQDAYDWAFAKCDADPVFNSRVASMIAQTGNPYEVAVSLRKEAADLDALRTGQAQPAPAPIQPVAEQPLPKSLVTAPGNGAVGKTHVNVGEGEAFNAAFS